MLLFGILNKFCIHFDEGDPLIIHIHLTYAKTLLEIDCCILICNSNTLISLAQFVFLIFDNFVVLFSSCY